MRKQRAADITEIPLPRRAQLKLVQSAGRSGRNASSILLHQKLLPPGPPKSAASSNGHTKTSQFCISSSSMGVRRLPSRVVLIGKGRFGKRPPSLIAEYVGPAIDSEDSGFGCDFHSSESQLSWCNEDSSITSKAVTNNTTSIQQPIFSLTSRALSNSNLSVASQLSTSSLSSPPPTSATTFTIPPFSTSTPEKQFLTNLLHESLDQEDAIDQFDGPYFTAVAATPTTTTPTLSNVEACSSQSETISQTPQSTVEPTKVLLILPGTCSIGTTYNNNTHPLDFTQVFGKLSPPVSALATNVNCVTINDLLNQSIATERPKLLQLGSDSSVIKIDHQESTKDMKLPPEIIHSNYESNSRSRISSFATAFPHKEDVFTKSRATSASGGSSRDSTLTTSPDSLGKLRNILIESSREAAGLDASDAEGIETKIASSSPENVVADVSSEDHMVILSQAVSLQKELFEEPALDGSPTSGKTTNITGFGFSKAITTAIPVTSLKGLIVDSLPTSNLASTTLVNVAQTQQVIDQSMKLMQLPENVRMSPDSTEPSVTVPSTLPFSTHQIANCITTVPPSTQMGVSSNSPTSTTAANNNPSPIPMKRSRFSFPHPATKGTGLKLRNQNQNQNYMPARSVGKRLPPGTTPTLTSNLAPFTRDGRAQLQIVAQPEEQHRARYQTEGSRGAIKDRKGNGFPTVKLVGYDKPATLQIFIGTDQGKVSPHMFYQACKVTGKSSTPCIEKKVEGTILIEIEFEPSKDMVISCDCVGILKERNVDVEQRFPFHHASQSRKKSTKCRMIFRTTVLNGDGIEETLQSASLPILCTQPPGVPEICKQSLTECPAKGGLELFVVGKNFLKDTRVIFQLEDADGNAVWEASSEPLKDYLQQNHLICAVPAFKEEKIMEPVECKVYIVSGGKHSEPHRFTYLPELVNNAHLGVPPLSSCVPNSQNQQQVPAMIQASLVQQIQNGQGLLPLNLQTVNVGTIIQSRDDDLVKSVIVSSPTAACSPVSISSADGSLCSAGSLESQSLSQPSPPAVVTTMNPLTALGFEPTTMIQTTGESHAVNTFQSVLQQAVQQQQQQSQQPENKVATLIKSASDLLESMKPTTASAATTAFSTIVIQEQKPVVTNAIPLDLQFPTQDLPTVPPTTQVQLSSGSNVVTAQLTNYAVQEAGPITTVSNPFQATEPQLNCVSLPQIMNAVSGIGINSSIPTTATATPVMAVNVPVNSPPQQQQATTATTNDVVMAAENSAVPVTVSAMTVANCLGQAIIKSEPTPTMNNDLRIAMARNAVVGAPGTLHGGAPPNAVMGLLGGDLQPHQGPIANALSQMSDNELINYINPNCFEGPLL